MENEHNEDAEDQYPSNDELIMGQFFNMTKLQKLNFLYDLLTNDEENFIEKYAEPMSSVYIDEDELVIDAPTLRACKLIKDNLIMSGYIIINPLVVKVESRTIVSYDFEGLVQPVCLN